MDKEQGVIEEAKRRALQHVQKPASHLEKPGFIYVLEAWPGTFKIGKASQYSSRVKRLQILFPYPLSLAYAFYTENYSKVEAALHALFRPNRLQGEWFDLDPIEDIALIQEGAHFSGFYERNNGEMVLDSFYIYNDSNTERPDHLEELFPTIDLRDLLDCSGYLFRNDKLSMEDQYEDYV